jgi:replicative DNA helicase
MTVPANTIRRNLPALQQPEEGGKLPPQAPELEQAVLGACLLDPSAIREISAILSPEHFYLDAHHRIWAAILAMDREVRKIDILTLMQELRKRADLDIVGGAFYISQLTNKVASSANVEAHARIISQKHLLRELIRISAETMRTAYDDTAEVFELLDSTYSHIGDLAGQISSGAEPVSMAEIHAKMVDNREQPELIRLGFGPVDECVALAPGDNTIIGARPSVGKTVGALVIARSVAEQGHKVAIITLEMTGTQLTARVSSSISGVDSNRITINSVNDAERDRMAQAGNAHGAWMDRVLVMDLATLNGNEIPGLFSRLAKKYGVKVIIIDYIQKMDGDGDTYRVIIDKISKKIKQGAKREGIRSITLSQLKRRDGADENPVMSDLLESGGLEADGDNIILLGRKKGEPVIKIDLAKNKFGPIGFWYLHFDLSHQRFGTEVKGPDDQTPAFNPALPPGVGQRELPPEPPEEDLPF